LTDLDTPFCAVSLRGSRHQIAKRTLVLRVEGAMKKAILALTMAATMVVAGTAAAADLSRGPTPYYANTAPAVYNWSGFYAGANAGYEWGKITNSSVSPDGLFGGLQGGFNWQTGQFVVGGETDIQGSGADDTFAPYKFSNPWFGTVRARAGWALNNVLFYGTFGLAYGEIKAENLSLDESKTHVGWTGGLGMEVGFTPNWSAKVEYLYMDLGNRAYSITGMNNGFETNMVRVGINYHF
jgi:outer membrane immunogenic protein